jgi:signal transduction histidine kinase
VKRPSPRSSRTAAVARRFAGLLFVLTMSFAWEGAVAADAKRVMVVHSFGRDFKPWSEYASAIRSELQRQSPWRLDIFDHSLMTARSSDQDPDGPFVAYLRALFANQPPDLLISIGAPAAAFFQRHRPQLFPNTPMVLTAVDERRVQFSTLSQNDAVVAVRIDYLGAIENILQVLPDTKNVMVVVGTSPIEQFWKEEISKSVKPLENRVSFTWTNYLSFDGLLKHAAALPPHSAIFWELMIVDAAGVVHEGNTALTRLHAVSNAPIFSYDESFFGHEIVGGPLLAVLDSSRETAAVAVRLLRGEKASDIKIPPVKFSTPKFDWREMQRWGISESRLPLGSEVLFRESTAWERYRWQIASILLALLVQSAIIAWLLVERYGRRSSRDRLLQVIHLNRSAEVGALSTSFAHDLRQPLAAIMLAAESAERLLEEKSPKDGRLISKLADVREAVQHATDITRHLSTLMARRSEAEVAEFDFCDVIADAVNILTPEATKRGVALRVNEVQRPLLVRADRIQLQQVMLNLVNNGMDAMADTALGARIITIQTTLSERLQFEVSVIDSGPGIPKDKFTTVFDTFYTSKKHGTGLGLSIVRTIIEAYGGKVWAENRLEGGAVIRFTLPLSSVYNSAR